MLAMKIFIISVSCHFNMRPDCKKCSTHKVFVRKHIENHCGSKIRAERFLQHTKNISLFLTVLLTGNQFHTLT